MNTTNIHVVEQRTLEEGVLRTWSNGYTEVVPYHIDENGEEYMDRMDLFLPWKEPNHE